MRIVVAGAGHGGLLAAGLLARTGHDVTVLEKKQPDALGHDWEDRFTLSLLENYLGIAVSDLPEGSVRVRGDCVFVSPFRAGRVEVRYPEERAQRVMWRKSLIELLLNFARDNGADLHFGVSVTSPLTESGRVSGVMTDAGVFPADLVVDACGVFSPLRRNLPATFGVERDVRRGDLFYAYRAYFDRRPTETDLPFEVYLCHNGEQGLSWYCANPDSADILIGRIDPLSPQKVEAEIAAFRAEHPEAGESLLHGGQYGFIPVRRPLTKMIADGYAAVGDSAFMTTPMNGMGIDLSLHAGKLLADTVASCTGPVSAEVLWQYNRMFHTLYGGDAAKNEGLKNALLTLPGEGVEFLFTSGVIQSSDLDGGGENMDVQTMLQKLSAGVGQPAWFGAVLRGVLRGAQVRALYRSAPKTYDPSAVRIWSRRIESLDIRL